MEAEMNTMLIKIREAVLLVLGIGIAAVNFGCSVRSVATSVPTRVFREVHGLRARAYPIIPVMDDLRLYRRVEVHPLENLMLDQIPEPTVKQLNTEIVNRVRSLNRFERITPVEETTGTAESAHNQSGPEVNIADLPPELVVAGYIDDFTPGIPALRYIEKGNNHAVLTVRITLKDKQTARLLGEINITVENTRVTSNVEKMVDKAADEVASFVGRNASRVNPPKEAKAYAK
jgi:hypothetical protein